MGKDGDRDRNLRMTTRSLINPASVANIWDRERRTLVTAVTTSGKSGSRVYTRRSKAKPGRKHLLLPVMRTRPPRGVKVLPVDFGSREILTIPAVRDCLRESFAVE